MGTPLSAAATPTDTAVAAESSSLPPIHVTVFCRALTTVNVESNTSEYLRDVAGEVAKAVLEAIDERGSNKQRTRHS